MQDSAWPNHGLRLNAAVRHSLEQDLEVRRSPGPDSQYRRGAKGELAAKGVTSVTGTAQPGASF